MNKARRNLELSNFDAAEYLTSPEAMAEYLKAAMEEAGDDVAYIVSVLGDIARSRGILGLSHKTGMTRQGIYKALAATGNPSFTTVLRVMDALGLAFVPVAKNQWLRSNPVRAGQTVVAKRAAPARVDGSSAPSRSAKGKSPIKRRRTAGVA